MKPLYHIHGNSTLEFDRYCDGDSEDEPHFVNPGDCPGHPARLPRLSKEVAADSEEEALSLFADWLAEEYDFDRFMLAPEGECDWTEGMTVRLVSEAELMERAGQPMLPMLMEAARTQEVMVRAFWLALRRYSSHHLLSPKRAGYKHFTRSAS